ncbi:MAG TPA: glycosyltransferase family 4 protein [Thermoanaerobaculia bacterium]|nr:glycosyltransferase family 4 protein [Thermoanaerobaculia bacterium]
MPRTRVMLLMETARMPSSWSAALQYRDSFAAAGYDARYVARDSPHGFEQRDRVANWAWRLRMRHRSHALKADIRRRWDDRIVELAKECDVVYALKIPSLELHQRIRALNGPRLLVLFADAFWLPHAREHGWRDLESILQIADGVVTVNEFTASYVRQFNERIFLVHDSPQTEDFEPMRGVVKRDPSRVTLGWIGSPLTAGSLYKIWEPLEDLFREFPNLHLRLAGTGPANLLNLPRFERVRWSSAPDYDHDGMIREVLGMDIGLYPLFRGDDAIARGALKAMIYMSGEAAVVAQNYAENPELIAHGVNGLLASTEQEWHDQLAFLIANPEERRRIAANGLATVRERYSRASTFEQLRAAIEAV